MEPSCGCYDGFMEVGAFAFIQDEYGKVLMVRDFSRNQHWTLPGGGLEFQELPTACVEREAKEEAGIDIKATRLLGIFSQKVTPGIVILLEGKILSGTPTPDGVETSECRFFSFPELRAIRDIVKPAQFSMVHQVLEATELPIFNHFVPPPEE